MRKRRYPENQRPLWPRFVLPGMFILSMLIWGNSIKTSFAEAHNSIVMSISEKIPGYKKNNSTSLKEITQNSLKDSQGTYGIYIENSRTGESYGYNERKKFYTASLYKIWIMAIVYQNIDDGKMTESDDLSADMADLIREFNIAPEDAQQAEGVVSMSVQEAIDLMITISDNNSALLLTDTISRPAVRAFLAKNSLTESKGGDGQLPVSTPYDITRFFKKLHAGEFASVKSTEKMISVLKKQELNTILPKYIESVPIAHKTGALDLLSHDAGIVYAPFGEYYITVMTDTEAPLDAEERMAGLSHGVYKYFELDAARRELNIKIISFILPVLYVLYAVVAILLIIGIWKIRMFIKSDTTDVQST
jgi:beta-lactamase class A